MASKNVLELEVATDLTGASFYIAKAAADERVPTEDLKEFLGINDLEAAIADGDKGDVNIAAGVWTVQASALTSMGITSSVAELNFVDGVTSNIQTQLDAKAPIANPTFTGNATFPNTGFKIQDTDASHTLTVSPGNLTANRILTLLLDADRTVTLSGSPTLDNWFDQNVKIAASPQFASVNIGHPTDTTITRVSAGVIAVEGVTLLTTATGQPLSANLTTWAGLAPSANAQSLVTAASYAAMRALLDLEAGTDFYSIAAANAAFQPVDAGLTALAAFNTNGLLVQTADNTFAGRTITQGDGITVTNGNGVAGNPTIAITVATQAEQEAAASNAAVVTPGNQHHHRTSAKAWCRVGVSADILSSYNITSATDVGAGVVTITIATDFSSANDMCAVSLVSGSTVRILNNTSIAAGSVQLTAYNSSFVAADPSGSYHLAVFGDQA